MGDSPIGKMGALPDARAVPSRYISNNQQRRSGNSFRMQIIVALWLAARIIDELAKATKPPLKGDRIKIGRLTLLKKIK